MVRQQGSAMGRSAGTAQENEVDRLKEEEPGGKYDDIINLPHHVSKKHPRMPMKNRAAQFAPFAALSGYGEAIREVTRITETKRELGESDREELDRKLACLQDHLAEDPEITVTYFLQDSQKEGGKYVDAFGRIRKIDLYHDLLVMEDGTKIRLEDILDLSGELFNSCSDV